MAQLSRNINRSFNLFSSFRAFSTSATANDKDSWLSKVFVRKIEPTKESHSRQLSDKEIIYELHTHNIRSDSMDKYLKNYKQTVDFIRSREDELKIELVGSWTVTVGDIDQCLHLYKYTGGFERVDNFHNNIWTDPDYKKLSQERGTMLRARHLQYLLAFSFWPEIVPRAGKNIYEIRSYRLQPGTMIEWGNNWARAINHRKSHDGPFAGFFSQIGRLYNVHHIWCYPSLQARKETREAAWNLPGWDECVAYTVPLIQDMHTRILQPTEFSPTQ
uniref:CSON010948 protein n=1 Tax=Culicoides sonorensis TaxID=179676 RepID=A0A336LQI5_CULSO